jgi:D-beta-D-heptose 7-phosphate kinase/D-beta-D-heptose 1-phosphate adenosyltransferase
MSQIKIIGESCVDVFVYCEALRLAPDLPVPVLRELHTEKNPGMAANVQRNIHSRSINAELITNPNWETVIKTRYVHDNSNHMFFRVDTSLHIKPINIESLELDSNIIVISDYNKGFLSENDIATICSSHPLVFLDTKKILGSWADEAAFIKINSYEFKNSQKFITDKLRSKIIHTRGAEGCDYQGVNYPVEKFDVRDTSGAGDSFMAALVAEFLTTSDIVESIKSANIAASKVVQTRGVGVI